MMPNMMPGNVRMPGPGGIRPNMPQQPGGAMQGNRMPGQQPGMFPNQSVAGGGGMGGGMVDSGPNNSNPMLRNHLEQNNMNRMQRPPQMQQQQQQQQQPRPQMPGTGGTSLLLSQLEKTPNDEPDEKTIQRKVMGLVDQVPNQGLSNVMPGGSNMQGMNQQQPMDIKQEIKQEIKTEPGEGNMKQEQDVSNIKQEPGSDVKPQIKSEVKTEIKSEPGASGTGKIKLEFFIVYFRSIFVIFSQLAGFRGQ